MIQKEIVITEKRKNSSKWYFSTASARPRLSFQLDYVRAFTVGKSVAVDFLFIYLFNKIFHNPSSRPSFSSGSVKNTSKKSLENDTGQRLTHQSLSNII